MTRPATPTVAGSRLVTQRVVRRLAAIPPLRPAERPNGPSQTEVFRAWEDLDWWSCAYCDAPFGPMVVREIDHVIPLAKGGLHTLHNLAPCCAECNRGKSDQPAAAWLAVLAAQGRY